MIRLDFPGYTGEGSLEEISWDEWFQKFDESGLALLVQDETARGRKSNFNKLVSRETAAESQKGRSSPRASSAGSSGRGPGKTSSRADETELEAYTDTDLYEEADADEDLEEDVDVEEARPVRVSGAGNTRNRKRQARTSTGRGTRAARSTATARQKGGQAGRSRSPLRSHVPDRTQPRSRPSPHHVHRGRDARCRHR